MTSNLSLKLSVSLLFIAFIFSSSQIQARPSAPSLGISPAVKYTSLNSGSTSNGSVIVTNGGGNTMPVNLSIQTFGVRAYSYTYIFTTPKDSWIHLSTSSVILPPHSSANVKYTVDVPAGSPPGGKYYMILASTTYQTGSITSTGQVASLVYITVNGNLNYSSHIVSSSINHFVIGGNINYKFTILGTGNVYSYVQVYGALHGLSAGPPSTRATHIIYPYAPRTVSGSINHPGLPGIYKVTYGYDITNGKPVLIRSWAVYLPPWFIALVLIVIILALDLIKRRKNKKKKSTGSKAQP